MQFEWQPIIKGTSAGLLLAEKLCKSRMSLEDQLQEWLTAERSVRICSGVTNDHKPSVCIVYEEGGIELAFGEISLSNFMRYYPHIEPVTDAFEDGNEISILSGESDEWFEARDSRAGRFWDGEFCVTRTHLSGAMEIGWSYATAYMGEACFTVGSEEEKESFLEATDPRCHPKGRIATVYYHFQEPNSGKGFGESVIVFMDEEHQAPATQKPGLFH